MKETFKDLKARGLIAAETNGAIEFLDSGPRNIYVGFDPTAPSLHVGNLVPLMMALRLKEMGHNVICLIGNATALIGDPSGKSQERPMMSFSTVMDNTDSIEKQIKSIIHEDFEIVENYDWMRETDVLSWMQKIGKHFNVKAMLDRESVTRRLESGDGMSWTEFSYMLVQSYDFLNLFNTKQCTVQIGGSDQWGNIVSGIDLIKKVNNNTAFGLTVPLLLNSQGDKMGKTGEQTVWLSRDLFSVFDFYQYWINLPDDDVERVLKFLTFISLEMIEEICHEHAKDPSLRLAQKEIANSLTEFVHGENGLKFAQKQTEILFGDSDVSFGDIENLIDYASLRINSEMFLNCDVCTALHNAEFGTSKSQVKRLIKAGGLSVNGNTIEDPNFVISEADLVNGCCVVRQGKKTFKIIEVMRRS